ADGRAVDLPVGDGAPGLAAVHRFPEAATDGAEVRFPRPTFDTAHRDGASAAIRSDGAPAERLEERRVDRRERQSRRRGVRNSVEGGTGDRRDHQQSQAFVSSHWQLLRVGQQLLIAEYAETAMKTRIQQKLLVASSKRKTFCRD